MVFVILALWKFNNNLVDPNRNAYQLTDLFFNETRVLRLMVS
jgi:hypothetical protein